MQSVVLMVAVFGSWAGSSGASGARLPDGRVFEQVTPQDKNGADVIAEPQRVRAAKDGLGVEFSSLSGFGDVRGMGVGTDYLAVRGAHGAWVTHGITPPQDATSLFGFVQFNFESRYMGEFSDDLSRGVFLARSPLTDAPNVAAAANAYLRTDLLTPGSGHYELLSDATTMQVAQPNGPFDFPQPIVAWASAGLTRVLFESTRNLTGDTVTAGLDLTQTKLYEWTDGTIRNVGVLPATEGGGSTVAEAGQGAVNHAYTRGTMSDDGRRVIFTAPPYSSDLFDGTLYLRDDGGTQTSTDDVTTRVNGSERTDCNDDPSCGGDGTPDLLSDPSNPGGVAPPATFWAASSDGAKVFFTTAEQLTDDDVNHSADLYRFDLAAPAGSRLTRLSVDGELGDNQGNDVHNGSPVTGVLGASADGRYVYFTVSQGQLVASGPTGPIGGPVGGERVFVWHDGVLREVGAVNSGDELKQILGETGWSNAQWSRVTPDGTHLAFVTQGSSELLQLYGHAGYDHGDSCPDLTSPQCQEIYVYNATANGGAGELQCASCNPTGVKARGDADFNAPDSVVSAALASAHLSRALSNDGRFVFFNSNDRLTPGDQNSTTDAYEFDTTTGDISLISSGTGNDPSVFTDASADGHDVFFATRDRLRSSDQDQVRDLYDARIDGSPDLGLISAHPCAGDSCRGPAALQDSSAVEPTVTTSGAPDRAEQAAGPAVFAIEPLGVRQRRALERRGRARIAIRVSEAGTLTVRMSARSGGHLRTIQATRRTIGRGATVKLQLRLDRVARTALVVRGQLRISIVVRYSHDPNVQTLHLVLGRAHG